MDEILNEKKKIISDIIISLFKISDIPLEEASDLLKVLDIMIQGEIGKNSQN